MRKAVAAIECNHMTTGIAFADAALKAANISLIGYELSKKAGGVVIKLEGEVSALRAAVDAGKLVADTLNGISGVSFIPRPMDCMDMMFRNKDTVGYVPELESALDPNPVAELESEPALEPESENESIEGTEEWAEFALKIPECESVPEKEIEDLKEEAVDENPEPMPEKKAVTCNICQDPACPRKKGEARSLCIHFEE